MPLCAVSSCLSSSHLTSTTHPLNSHLHICLSTLLSSTLHLYRVSSHHTQPSTPPAHRHIDAPSHSHTHDHVPSTRRAPGPRRQWRPPKRQWYQRHQQRRPRGIPVRLRTRHCELAEPERDTPLTASRSAFKTDQSKKVQSSNPYAPVGDFLSNVR